MICTPVAFDGPLFKTVIVKSTFEPIVTVPLLEILVTPKSAWETIAVASEAESLAVLTSLPPATVAVLVTGVDAACATVTVMVMTG